MATTLNSTSTSPQPSTVKPLDPTISRQYVGYFLYQNKRTEPKFKVFDFVGLLREAVGAFRKHCEIMGYRFISVRPFKVDLREQEERKLSDPSWEEDFDS